MCTVAIHQKHSTLRSIMNIFPFKIFSAVWNPLKFQSLILFQSSEPMLLSYNICKNLGIILNNCSAVDTRFRLSVNTRIYGIHLAEIDCTCKIRLKFKKCSSNGQMPTPFAVSGIVYLALSSRISLTERNLPCLQQSPVGHPKESSLSLYEPSHTD